MSLIKITHPVLDWVWINPADFDPDRHVLYVEPVEAPVSESESAMPVAEIPTRKKPAKPPEPPTAA